MFVGYRPQQPKNPGGCACACGCRNTHDDVRWKGYYLCSSCWAEMNQRFEELVKYSRPKHP